MRWEIVNSRRLQGGNTNTHAAETDVAENTSVVARRSSVPLFFLFHNNSRRRALSRQRSPANIDSAAILYEETLRLRMRSQETDSALGACRVSRLLFTIRRLRCKNVFFRIFLRFWGKTLFFFFLTDTFL